MNKDEFIRALSDLGIKLNTKQLSQLDEYYRLLKEENKKYNLTSITDENQVYLKHFYDSLTISKIVELSDQKVCDIGTGAGFPGMVLKIAFPQLNITLVDSTTKKCSFLNKVILKLKLTNINVINERAEIYSRNVREEYDIVTSRAVAPLTHLLEYSIPLLKVGGMYIAMKGDISNEKIDINHYMNKLSLSLEDKKCFELPYENSVRTLVLFKKNKKTDIKYPREYKVIKKKNL